MTIAQPMLEEFERELNTTRKFLEQLPQDVKKLAWRPHEKSMTLGQLALHIAQVPFGVLSLGMSDEGEPPDFSSREEPADTRAVLDALDRSADFVRKTLPSITDSRMRSTWKLVKNGQVIMSMPRESFLRSILLNHWYHHRGQLGVYLRLIGAKVPSSYGPSGDEV